MRVADDEVGVWCMWNIVTRSILAGNTHTGENEIYKAGASLSSSQGRR